MYLICHVGIMHIILIFFFSFLFHTYFLKITAPKGGICKNGCFPMVRWMWVLGNILNYFFFFRILFDEILNFCFLQILSTYICRFLMSLLDSRISMKFKMLCTILFFQKTTLPAQICHLYSELSLAGVRGVL